jgi:ribosomal protein S7
MELKNLLINCLMKQGNKQVAQKILQNTLRELQLKTNNYHKSLTTMQSLF